jgi:cytochrome b6-f complex iron-sulfur subunit
MNRRDLIQRVVLGGTVLVLVPSVLESCTKSSTPDPGKVNQPGTKIDVDLTLAANSDLNNSGGSKIIQGIIFANTGNNNFIALSSVCTHLGCTVGYNYTANNIQCPCHGSVYATSGAVVNGPAPLPLQSYTVTKTGNILSITL